MDSETLLISSEHTQENLRRVNFWTAGQSGLGVSMKDSIGELSTCDNHRPTWGRRFERSKDFR